MKAALIMCELARWGFHGGKHLQSHVLFGIWCCDAESMRVSEVSVIFSLNYTQPGTVCFLCKPSLRDQWIIENPVVTWICVIVVCCFDFWHWRLPGDHYSSLVSDLLLWSVTLSSSLPTYSSDWNEKLNRDALGSYEVTAGDMAARLRKQKCSSDMSNLTPLKKKKCPRGHVTYNLSYLFLTYGFQHFICHVSQSRCHHGSNKAADTAAAITHAHSSEVAR